MVYVRRQCRQFEKEAIYLLAGVDNAPVGGAGPVGVVQRAGH